MIFSVTRAVFYLDGFVVYTIRQKIKLFLEKEYNIRKVPSSTEEYEAWCDMIYEARGQIGLQVEQDSVKSNVGWTKGAEGTILTEKI